MLSLREMLEQKSKKGCLIDAKAGWLEIQRRWRRRGGLSVVAGKKGTRRREGRMRELHSKKAKEL